MHYGVGDRVAATEAAIETEVQRLPIEIVVGRLTELVGVVVTGAVGNVMKEQIVRRWIDGDLKPERESQLRFAYRIALMLAAAQGAMAVQSWFKGSNASLGDRSPALVLRDDFSDATQLAILNSVRRLGQ
jgi:hypothetical protein